MEIISWSLPAVATVSSKAMPAFQAKSVLATKFTTLGATTLTGVTGNIPGMREVDDILAATVVYGVLRFIFNLAKLPDMVIKAVDYLFAGVILWNVYEIVIAILEGTIEVMGGR